MYMHAYHLKLLSAYTVFTSTAHDSLYFFQKLS